MTKKVKKFLVGSLSFNLDEEVSVDDLPIPEGVDFDTLTFTITKDGKQYLLSMYQTDILE